ncbi:hypothetical protein [Streptomyces sp. NPDC101145]|uniref:hypothetical protein n=1 Tax=Streptomyces sp. NPDC101145 TaxID=3366112 RepID=UPI0037FC7BFB
MTTHTEGTHHWVITLEIPGRAAFTQDGTYTPRPGETRSGALHALLNSITEQKPHLRGANITFFSIEPNQL